MFSRGGPAFTQSTCGHGGKQMWEHQKASLALQTFSAASRGDPVRHQRCRHSVNHVSTGFSCPSLLITFLTLIRNLLSPPPSSSQKKWGQREREREKLTCICFSCLSTSLWNYCISIYSKKLQLNIYTLLSSFMPVAFLLHYSSLDVHASCNFSPLTPSILGLFFFFPLLQTALCLCVSSSLAFT